MSDELSKVFDVEPTPKQEVVYEKPEEKNKDVEDDFEETRKNLRVLLLQGQDALMGALEVAKQSEHPRAFEVVGDLVKKMADVNQQLLDIHKQKQNLEKKDESKSPTKQVTNNSIFVGSTDELNKLINSMNKGD